MTDSPAKTRKKTLMRTVRMSEEEFELFGEFCRAQGVTPSEALRRLARSAALLGPTFSGEARAEVVALTRQMRSIGNNLNQIARHLNTIGDLRDWSELREALVLHKRAVGRVVEL